MYMLKKRTFFWLALPLCLLILALWGYHMYNKPHQSAGEERSVQTIDADSLYSQYQHDEKDADQRYLNKVIEVTGKFSEVQHSGQSEIWILSTQTGMGAVNCQLFGDRKETVHPQPGDKVRIKGRCTGFLMDVMLADCVPQ